MGLLSWWTVYCRRCASIGDAAGEVPEQSWAVCSYTCCRCAVSRCRRRFRKQSLTPGCTSILCCFVGLSVTPVSEAAYLLCSTPQRLSWLPRQTKAHSLEDGQWRVSERVHWSSASAKGVVQCIVLHVSMVRPADASCCLQSIPDVDLDQQPVPIRSGCRNARTRLVFWDNPTCRCDTPSLCHMDMHPALQWCSGGLVVGHPASKLLHC